VGPRWKENVIVGYLSKLGRKVPKSWDRLPPTLALVCVVLLAAWMGSADGGYFVDDWAPPAFILVALLLLVSVIGFSGGTKFRWSALALGLFTAYTAWTSASLLWSPNKGDAWLGAGQTLLYLLAFWVAVGLLALGASRRWVLGASVLGPAFVAACTLPNLDPRFEDLFRGGRLVGTVGYYSGEAAFLLIPFWVAVYLAGGRHVNPVLRGAALASAVLSADLSILTQSRGAMVAMGVSLPVFFLLSGQRLRGLLALIPVVTALYIAFPGLDGIYSAFSEQAQTEALLGFVLPTVWLTTAGAGLYGLCWGLIDRRWSPPDSVVRVAGSIVLAGCMVVLVAGTVTLTERAGDPAALVEQKWEAFKTNDTIGQEQSRYLSASGTARYVLWQVAWKDFAAHPLLGVGTQNYEATFYRLRERSSWFSARQPHTLPLEILGERGVVGGALFFGFLVACLAVGLRERFTSLHSERNAQVGALVAAVVYWFVYSSSEWFWQIPAVTLPAIVYLALLVSPWRSAETTTEFCGRFCGWPLRVGGVAVAVLTVAAVVPIYVADYYLEESREATDPVEGLAMVERAQRFNPLNPELPEREAALAIETGDWDRVEEAYDRAIQLNPEHYAPYMSLATFYERRGELDKALLYYQKALTLNPLSDDLKRRIGRLEN
jgi:O-Antigen ligase